MKKLIYFGMGMLLCLSAAVWTGCDKDKENLNESASAENGEENYVETAFGMELQMVYVEGGTFMMGATEEQGDDVVDAEKPVHSVTLDGFYIGKYEITQAQWEAVMGTTVAQQCNKEFQEQGGDMELRGVGDNYPMYYVSWEEVQSFCKKLSAQAGKKYRLPTEAEWEYAARGGNKADGTKYAGSDNIDEVAWNVSNGKSDETSYSVGMKRPNGLGLYDMTGNVWEWCSDWFGESYYSISSTVNPRGPSYGSNRVIRGGSWYDDALYCRVSSRHCGMPDIRLSAFGFRIVCEAK